MLRQAARHEAILLGRILATVERVAPDSLSSEEVAELSQQGTECESFSAPPLFFFASHF